MEKIIIEASEYEGIGDYNAMFDCIRRGLTLDNKNYELYLLLGNYYLAAKGNPWQALLCYENALFFCQDAKDREIIKTFIDSLKENYCVNVPDTAIVIVSYNSCDLMKGCLNSIIENVDLNHTKIIVVDNGSEDGIAEYLETRDDITFYKSKENLGFGRGSNLGIDLASKEDDIFFLNNDTIMTANALFWLKMTIYEEHNIGAAGCYSNYPGNDQSIYEEIDNPEYFLEKIQNENIPIERLGFNRIWLSGFALLCKRTVLNKTGGFDDIYGTGYFEDNDLSMKMLKLGYKLRACPNSAIYHYGSSGFKKNPEKTRMMLAKNRKLFMSKWDGIDLNDYSQPDLNIVAWIGNIVANKDCAFSVLGYNCKAGVTLSKISEQYRNARTIGIEDDERLYDIAKIYHIVFRDLEQIKGEEPFDFVISEKGEVIIEGDNCTQIKNKYLKQNGFLIFTISSAYEPELIQSKLYECGFGIRKINGIYFDDNGESKMTRYIVISQIIMEK